VSSIQVVSLPRHFLGEGGNREFTLPLERKGIRASTTPRDKDIRASTTLGEKILGRQLPLEKRYQGVNYPWSEMVSGRQLPLEKRCQGVNYP
jgi:hypothetical protein